MPKTLVVKFTANFERNLAEIEQFLYASDAAGAYDELLDELVDTVIPNLERFPSMGQNFLSRLVGSQETREALVVLRNKLAALVADPDGLREYVMQNYLVLYAQIRDNIYLLSVLHHRQLSFDFESHWISQSQAQ